MEQSQLHTPPPLPVASKRPVIITVICILNLLGIFIGIVFFSDSDAIKEMGDIFQVYLIGTFIISAVCTVFLWRMKKWAAYIYIGLFAVNQVLFLATGTWNILSLIIPGAISVILLMNLNKMD